jgi:hypothetical protein
VKNIGSLQCIGYLRSSNVISLVAFESGTWEILLQTISNSINYIWWSAKTIPDVPFPLDYLAEDSLGVVTWKRVLKKERLAVD